MVETITVIYLVYSFIAFYFLFLFMLIYFQNRDKIFYVPEPNKNYSLSMVIPCYNGEEAIGGTIQGLVDEGYKNLKRIIVVDDCSTDNSFKIMKEYEKKYPGLVKVVQTPKNTGNAAGAKNYGAKFVDTELIGFTDDDSFVELGAINKMVGFFNEDKVGSVTSSVLVHNRGKFIERLQSIEYKVIKFSRKLLEFVDSIYVTPGPLGLFRKSAFDKIGGFDEKNLTEDIEITWHLQAEGYKIKMAVPARSYSIAPSKIKDWVKQRNRWNIGGLQTIGKYKKDWFRKGMLGNFILPFFVFSWVIGIFGLFVLVYRVSRRLFLNFVATKLSVEAETAIIRFSEINLTPNVLVFLGLTVFFLSLWYTIVALLNMAESKNYKRENFFTVGFYMLFYLLAYPIILIISGYKFLRGKATW